MFSAKRACALLTMCVLILSFPTGSSTEEPANSDVVRDQVVVRFHDAVPEDAENEYGQYGEIIQNVPNLRFITLRIDPTDAQPIINDIETREEVLEAYHPGRVYALHTPNDPMVPSQWGIPAIGMEQAWDLARGNFLAKVAVLDTGTMYTHEDLAPNTAAINPLCGPDYNVFTGTPDADDDHFHGTHVAGTVAAVTDNAVGVAGMGQSCVMTVKVLSNFGGGTWEGVAEGVDHATTFGAHIISMSLGGGGGSPVLEEAVNNANDAGVLVIAAAGNSGCWLSDSVLYPAKYEAVMAVGALRAPGDVIAGFSSCGPAVEISAPGQDIISTRLGGGYNYLSGTSMATPHVSGVAGLMKGANPFISGPEMRCILNDSADDLGAAGRDPFFGHGRLDAAEAVQRAIDIDADPCSDGQGSPIPPLPPLPPLPLP